jgi:energy-coupling factor transporter ATP-binding protein EcfA2
MYEEFYGLKAKPFSLVPDPEFLYWGGPHSMAFAMLEYGVVNHSGFTVITGEIGSGKTTLIRHLLKKLPGDVTVGLVSNFQGDRGELLKWLLMAFGQNFDGQSYLSQVRRQQGLSRAHGPAPAASARCSIGSRVSTTSTPSSSTRSPGNAI